MNKKFTKLIAALALLVFMTPSLAGWGQTRENVTDEITASDLAATSNTYTDFSNVSKTSDAVYAGNSAKDSSENIQMRSKNSNSGIVSTTSGGTISSIKITVGSGSNTIDVYGSNTAYTSAVDLYSSSTQGTKLGSLTETGTITVDGSYAYVGVRSNNGAIYLSKIEFVWTTTGGDLAESNLALTEAPVALSFDLYNNSSAQVINYTTLSTGAVTVSENDYVTTSVNESAKTITVTPKTSVTPSTQTITVSQAADATYAAGSVTFTVTISDSTPIPTHTATFSVNGTTSTQDFAEGAAITFPSDPEDINGMSFVGWSASAIDGTTNTDPTFVSSATMGNSDITYYAVFADVTPGTVTTKTDNLTTSTFGSPSSYTTWSGKSATDGSDAVYAGNSTTNSSAIQIRATSPSGIVSTTSGGKAKKVTVTWNSSTATDRALDVYGKSTAYSGSVNLYGTSAEQGTKIGSIVYGTSTELTISTDYEYIGMRSNTGAMYLDQISINWESVTPDTYSNYCTTINVAVARPTITVASNPFYISTTVTITCDTEGAAIKYSYDNETWNDYSAALTIHETKTIYAKAIKGDDESMVASVTATKNLATPIVTIDASGLTNTNVFGDNTAAGSLSASVKYNNVAIADATVTWDGNNDDVATINATTGVVTLVAAGSVTFTASYDGDSNDYGPSSNTYVLTVINEDPGYTTIWSEDFSSYSANNVPNGGTYNYACSDGGGSTTQIYNNTIAGGSAPELLVSKSNGSFTATIPLGHNCIAGDLKLTYKTNAKSLNVKTTTTGLTVYGEESSGAGLTYNTSGEHTITFKGVTTSTTSITIVFTATSSDNVRLDDIMLKGVLAIPVDKDAITDDVTIPAGVTWNVSDITIPSTNTLTVNGILNVSGTLTNSGTAANLIIEDGGQLITDDVVEGTIKKTISAYDPSLTGQGVSNGWNFISYPLNTNGTSGDAPTEDWISNMITTGSTYDLYELNENTWINYKAHTDDFTLSNGHGYLYANASTVTLEFAGSLNFRDPENDFVSLDNTGWNLVGNPFAYNTYPSMSYYKINAAGTGIDATEYTTADAVPPCTGILVNSDAGLITFSKTAPEEHSIGNHGNIEMTLAQQATNRGNATTLDNAIVSFNEGSQLGKFYFGTQNANLYIPQGNEEYAIVSSEGQGEMPVNFRANENGTYTLTVNAENVEMNYLHLIDNMTGADIDLLQTPSYTFDANTKDYESRFRLVFSAANGSEDDNEAPFAYFNGSEWMVYANANATLQVVDMTGRVIVSQSATNHISTNGMAQGVYVLRLLNGETVRTQKIVVR
jgi:hypothetical protein